MQAPRCISSCTRPRTRSMLMTRAAVLSSQDELAMHTTQGSHGQGFHHPSSTSYFFNPSIAVLGPGALTAAGDEIKKLGLKNALIVTDAVLHKIGATNPLTELLTKLSIKYTLYDGCEPNPTVDQVNAGANLAIQNGCDFVVSFGGGSPHDCAKAVAALITNGGKVQDFEGLNNVKKPMLPLVAINTTAGTAAEMTRFCIITDSARHVKMAIVDNKLTPTIAVNDSNLMVGMPKGLTAATGMDALTHAVEAYVSTASTPVTDASALHAIRLISAYLREAVTDGTNLKAREMMAYAEYLAGIAFNNASLGYVHAMAHQLGGFYNLPHGVCNAILLPVVMEYNSQSVPELFIDIAEAMGIKGVGEDSQLAIKKVLEEVRSLSTAVGIPRNLQALPGGLVKREDFPTLATNAMKDACGLTNPIQPDHATVMGLYEKAFSQ
jgi:alcohol dehydrogenase